ncbi:zinc finger protein 768-like [Brachionus plicatilis]|uniref:Zinc finger protein 768-like n=1 Tax=Brachionus plicatilis TaxID=10195 RepID=A0A3M7QVY0_BRAPC|nr:zinc finger protein 768-like [Brachionus plicatilis]
MEIKLEPVHNLNETRSKTLSTSGQTSAFKPLLSQSAEQAKYKLKLEDAESSSSSSVEFSSSSSTSSTASSSSRQSNPFYIDKIFNFQNMYLFPGSSGHMDNLTPGQSHPAFYNPLMLNDLQHLMHQNLQNFYSSLNQVKTPEQEPAKAKNNFSIERILSMPSDLKNCKKAEAIPNYMAANQPIFYPKFNRFNAPIGITAPIPSSVSSLLNKQSKPVGSIRGYKFENCDPKDQLAPKSNKNAKKYKCDLCGRGFSRSNTLITHRRIHTGEKPFECNICGRAFRQPGNLTRHKLTHTTIKPYSCNKCGKSFNRVSNLHAHIKIHSDGKPYVCIVCGMGFYQKVDLKLHALAHSSDKMHECSFCKRTFKQAAHLKYHLHSHLKQFDKYDNELKQLELKRLEKEANDSRVSDSVHDEIEKKIDQEFEEHEDDEDMEEDEMVEEFEDDEELNEEFEESDEDLNEIEIENISNEEENSKELELNIQNDDQNNSSQSN